jgi:hypothetical protein
VLRTAKGLTCVVALSIVILTTPALAVPTAGAALSTSAPSTIALRTIAPSTIAPRTSAPSTSAPRTIAPSTSAPSTIALSTIALSTIAAPTALATESSGSLRSAEQSLISGVMNGQEAIFKQLNAGLAMSLVKSSRSASSRHGRRAFIRGERDFLAQAGTAASDFLDLNDGSTLARKLTGAGQAWLRLSKSFAIGAPGVNPFIKATVTAEIALWKTLGDGVDAYRRATPNGPAFQKVAEEADRAFVKRLRQGVGLLLKGLRIGRSDRTAGLALLDRGARSFTSRASTGIQSFLKIESNAIGPPPGPTGPPSAPPSPPSLPTPPQTTHLSLHCPTSAKTSEVLHISGTLSPAPAGASVQLLYEAPPSGTGTPPPPISRQIAVAADGSFSDASITPEDESPAGGGSLAGTWMVEATYAGNATQTTPIPQLCEIKVEQ